MQLLNIVGIIWAYNTFNAAFAFLNSEREADFCWALRLKSEKLWSNGWTFIRTSVSLQEGSGAWWKDKVEGLVSVDQKLESLCTFYNRMDALYENITPTELIDSTSVKNKYVLQTIEAPQQQYTLQMIRF